VEVVDNDGEHGMEVKSGSKTLTAGQHVSSTGVANRSRVSSLIPLCRKLELIFFKMAEGRG